MNDGSFETPALSTGDLSSSRRQFGPGISRPRPAWPATAATFTSGNPNAPDGNQVAFIQGSGSMSQSVDLIAGSYNISFEAAQRCQ